MEQDLPLGQIGLYIHIPWCLRRCGYCNFFARDFRRQDFEAYYNTLLREKQLYQERGIPALDSVYFGGGTPSLLSGSQISGILKDLPLSPNPEITLEVNPIQITPTFVRELATTPVNRISLGVQSMNDEDLSYLGRRHRAADIAPKVQMLRDSGFTNISADFIYGIPGRTEEDIRRSLELLLALPFTHISCYLLELYEDTPLGKDADKLPGDEACEAQYHMIRSLLSEYGFAQYEISNFARPGSESRHNLLYWEGSSYLAWGASACGFYRGLRYQNPADIDKYHEYITAGRIYGDLDPDADEIKDYIMMRLRLSKGLDLQEFSLRFQQDFLAQREQAVTRLVQLGMLIRDKRTLRLSPQAMFISNAVIAELL